MHKMLITFSYNAAIVKIINTTESQIENVKNYLAIQLFLIIKRT